VVKSSFSICGNEREELILGVQVASKESDDFAENNSA
jgi:hypothetical protein